MIENALILMVAVPLVAAVLNALVGKYSPHARQGISIAATLAMVVMASALL